MIGVSRNVRMRKEAIRELFCVRKRLGDVINDSLVFDGKVFEIELTGVGKVSRPRKRCIIIMGEKFWNTTSCVCV